jgi:S-adenosylmethionine uptake transporter
LKLPASLGTLPASVLMILASFLFASMGVCVKLASDRYSSGEIVFYRGVIGAVMLFLVARARGGSLKTRVPAMHFWRAASGVSSLFMWFYAIGHLPLATAMTLNYMSSVWMALFLLGGAVMLGAGKVDPRLVFTVLLGFGGVALILQPTLDSDQMFAGLIGLLSGVLSATVYLQVASLGRLGEPDYRIGFYFSIGGTVAGALWAFATGFHPHSFGGALLLLAVGLLATTAQLLMTRAYAIGRPLVNASLQYLGIAFAFVYGVVLFADAVTWAALGGMTLIVAAGLSATLLRRQAVPEMTADPVSE